jgi:hypothetical protein
MGPPAIDQVGHFDAIPVSLSKVRRIARLGRRPEKRLEFLERGSQSGGIPLLDFRVRNATEVAVCLLDPGRTGPQSWSVRSGPRPSITSGSATP